MNRVLIGSLLLGSKFKLFSDGCLWTIIELDPKIYSSSVRASSGRITAPFNKSIFVIPC